MQRTGVVQRKLWSAAATSPWYWLESAVPEVNHRIGHGAPARRRFGFGDVSITEVLRRGESAVAAARVGPSVQVPGKCRGISHRGVRCGRAALPAHSKAVWNP